MDNWTYLDGASLRVPAWDGDPDFRMTGVWLRDCRIYWCGPRSSWERWAACVFEGCTMSGCIITFQKDAELAIKEHTWT